MTFIKQPFDEFLGFQYERMSPTNIRVRLPLKPLYFNSVGVVHGGVISSLVDVAMSNLVEAEHNGVQTAVTVDLHMTFLQGAKGEVLLADAYIVKQARTLMYADCVVYDDKDEVVAKGTGTFFMRHV
ncbi:PaaI family thioesterase [Alicyclobacillus pomorum]|uniref:PaaI family thioesterase n=1 Tax=Alicyclobacillus pomorum TaxID=204470 RepID=UPI0005566561|nr:PaaI family thioesterase [Alicyclobacillus pomorum]